MSVGQNVEHRRAAAEEHRYQVDLHLVEQSRGQTLPADVGAAHHRHALVPGDGLSLLHGTLEPVGHEVVDATVGAVRGCLVRHDQHRPTGGRLPIRARSHRSAAHRIQINRLDASNRRRTRPPTRQ